MTKAEGWRIALMLMSGKLDIDWLMGSIARAEYYLAVRDWL